MRNTLYRILFGQGIAEVENERDDLRRQTVQLTTRLEVLADERESQRERISELERLQARMCMQMVDGMLVNSNQLPYFGSGPKLPDPPQMDYAPAMERSRHDETRRKNQEFLEQHDLRLQSDWNPEQPEVKNGDAAQPAQPTG